MRIIPKRFWLGPHHFITTIRGDLIEEEGAYGMMHIGKQTIHIQEVIPEFNKESQLQTFLHELVHAILEVMGWRELSENEKFVEGFSQLLYQFMKTRRNK